MSQVKFTDGKCDCSHLPEPVAVKSAGKISKIGSQIDFQWVGIFNVLFMFAFDFARSSLRREGVVLPWAADLRGEAAEDAR